MGVQRKHIRFKAEDNVIAWLSLDSQVFHKDRIALVSEESFSGCKLVFAGDLKLKEGQLCILKVGELGETVSELRWIKKIEDGVFVAGFQYHLEN